MFDVPLPMKRRDRPAVQDFDDEKMYIRVPPVSYRTLRPGAPKMPLFAVMLPEKSFNRSGLGGQPQYVLYDVVNERYYPD